MNGLKSKTLEVLALIWKYNAKDYLEYMADCRNLLLHLTQSVLLVVLINTIAAQLPQWDWVKGVFRPSSLNSYDLTDDPQSSLKFRHTINCSMA